MAGSLRRKVLQTVALGSMIAIGGCYHTITTTNLSPGPVHVVQWVPTFIYGLVPGTVDAGKMCGGKGVQNVDSQASFLNVVVGAVTFGIFTPMQVTVTCAG